MQRSWCVPWCPRKMSQNIKCNKEFRNIKLLVGGVLRYGLFPVCWILFIEIGRSSLHGFVWNCVFIILLELGGGLKKIVIRLHLGKWSNWTALETTILIRFLEGLQNVCRFYRVFDMWYRAIIPFQCLVWPFVWHDMWEHNFNFPN